MLPDTCLLFQIERDKKRKEEGKRARAEKEEVMEKLFSAFEKHQYYTLKDLVHITQQPVVCTKYWQIFLVYLHPLILPLMLNVNLCSPAVNYNKKLI